VPRGASTARAARPWLTRQESAEAAVPAGITSREGPNIRRAEPLDDWMAAAMIAANPRTRAWRMEKR
jgi:hypothetical protein